MKVVDLNVILYAVNADAREHAGIRRWWEGALGGHEPIGLAWIVLLGFLRLTTRRGLFPSPLAPDDALERVRRWLASPVVSIVREGDDHFELLARWVGELGTAGNLTSDLHLAAIAVHHRATVISCDSDFGRLSGVRWERPV